MDLFTSRKIPFIYYLNIWFHCFLLQALWITSIFLIFRLYLSTELENPNFFPSVYNFVTIINFTVTFQGLQDELLSTVVSHEVPHLENQRAQLLESISLDAITLEELEDKTLTLLQKAEGEEGNVVQSRDLKSQGKGMSLFSDWYQPCLASVSTR